ncbi:hypothetical protein C8Q74DRAFT_123107 [Fomes fomentarius]|nr:hypothetical protein C8Q74DRAFT_123107 [Fomes fomentarius]
MPQYIGKPPPYLLKRKLREISPEVPDPEPVTPARKDVFGTPSISARVLKTYAHKRARSYASSAPEEPNRFGDEEESSSDSSPERSPTKRNDVETSKHVTTRRFGSPAQQSTRTTREHDVEPPVAGPSNPAPNPSSSHRRRRQSFLTVYVEVPHPSSRMGGRSVSDASPVGPSSASITTGRGRPSIVKAIAAIPTPSSSSEGDAAQTAQRRPRAPSGPSLTLSEALNHSFASASPAQHEEVGATPTSYKHMRAEKEEGGTPSAPPKRKRGRPRGRGRGRGVAVPVQVVSRTTHLTTRSAASSPTRPSATGGRATPAEAEEEEDESSDDEVALLVPAKRPRGRPTKQSTVRAQNAVGTSSRHPQAEEEEESTGDEPARVVPAKRPRGRPRKHPLPEPGQTRPNAARSVSRGRQKTTQLPSSSQNAYDSVDVNPIARALENQAAQEAQDLHVDHVPASSSGPPPKRGRGRPRGSKNKSTLERERRTQSAGPFTRVALPSVEPQPSSSSTLLANPIVAPPIKRPRGRPRKSAPNPPTTFPASEPATFDYTDYTEPLKDPDADNGPGPAATPKRRGRSQSQPRTRSRANSTAAPASVSASASAHVSGSAVPPPSYYLDMTTLQWRPRARSASASPSKPKFKSAYVLLSRAPKPEEHQTSVKLYAALKTALLNASPAKTGVAAAEPEAEIGQEHEKEKEKAGEDKDKDDGLRVAPSGVLLLADKGKEKETETETETGKDGGGEVNDATVVFRGTWAILVDPKVTCDDALALKTLHDVVKGVGVCINLDNVGPTFTESDDGRTVTVAVPCGCQSIPGRALQADQAQANQAQEGPASEASPPPECAGEMAVSVTEEETPADFVGIAKALRMTVTVVH